MVEDKLNKANGMVTNQVDRIDDKLTKQREGLAKDAERLVGQVLVASGTGVAVAIGAAVGTAVVKEVLDRQFPHADVGLTRAQAQEKLDKVHAKIQLRRCLSKNFNGKLSSCGVPADCYKEMITLAMHGPKKAEKVLQPYFALNPSAIESFKHAKANGFRDESKKPDGWCSIS